jgi:hypothetical protein
MPDFSGQGKGLFPITLCDGLEHSAHAGHMHHHPHDGGHCTDGVCPFAVNAVAALHHVDVAINARPAGYAEHVSPPARHSTRQAVFSNASSRSPPFLS